MKTSRGKLSSAVRHWCTSSETSNRFIDEKLLRLLAAMQTPKDQLLQTDDWEALMQ